MQPENHNTLQYVRSGQTKPLPPPKKKKKNSLLHLHGGNGAGEDAATNVDMARKWALLVNKVTFDGLTRRLEAKTRVACVPELRTIQTAA